MENKQKYFGYFAPGDPSPLAIIREDQMHLSQAFLRINLPDYQNLQITPMPAGTFAAPNEGTKR